MGLASIKMAAALLLILGAIYLALALLKRYGLATRFQAKQHPCLRIEERVVLGPRKQLLVVRFLNKQLVLGVTDSGINLITEYEADHEQHITFSEALEQKEREADPPL